MMGIQMLRESPGLALDAAIVHGRPQELDNLDNVTLKHGLKNLHRCVCMAVCVCFFCSSLGVLLCVCEGGQCGTQAQTEGLHRFVGVMAAVALLHRGCIPLRLEPSHSLTHPSASPHAHILTLPPTSHRLEEHHNLWPADGMGAPVALHDHHNSQ